LRARLRGVRRSLRALTTWHPYGRAYANPRWWQQLLHAAIINPGPPDGSSPEEAIVLVVTCDLELDPPWEERSWDHRSLRGIEEGLPRLLDLLDAREIRGTFFTEGILARLAPDFVREVLRRGHEIGCHGLAHESYGGPYRIDETIPQPPTLHGRSEKEITARRAKDLLEDLTGVQVRSFRAPFLHIDSTGSAAVADAGFLVDSSLQNRLFGCLSAPSHLDPGNVLSRSSDRPTHPLIVIPMSVDPKPRFRSHHPYVPVDQTPRPWASLKRIISASTRVAVTPTLVLLVHPWEFVEGFPNPFGLQCGTPRKEKLERLLDCLETPGPIRPLPMGTLAAQWEQSLCPWHAGLTPDPSPHLISHLADDDASP